MSSRAGSADEQEAPTPPETRSRQGTPRWVKVFATIGVVVVLLVIVLLFAGGHGPGRHGSDAGGHTSPVEHAGGWP